MPFKLGAAPIRRTIKYLESGPLVFRDKVKCVMVNYNVDEEMLYVKDRPELHPVRRAAMEKKPWWIKAGPEHKGAQDFAFWNLPQVQYKNPSVQIVVQRNMTPTPFITCFLDDGKNKKGHAWGSSPNVVVARHATYFFCFGLVLKKVLSK